MKFTKMHGCGNDYIYINGFVETVRAEEKPELVRKMSDRHFGIGGDGVIFINPSEEADFEIFKHFFDVHSELYGTTERNIINYCLFPDINRRKFRRIVEFVCDTID